MSSSAYSPSASEQQLPPVFGDTCDRNHWLTAGSACAYWPESRPPALLTAAANVMPRMGHAMNSNSSLNTILTMQYIGCPPIEPSARSSPAGLKTKRPPGDGHCHHCGASARGACPDAGSSRG